MDTILLVDDEAKLREVLAMALQDMGWNALTAATGEEALAALAREDVRLVLCDLRMPRMNGRQLLENIKQTRPELPVIIMTAFADLKEAVELIKAGAFDYLAKPFDLDALEATVTGALRFHALSEDNSRLRRTLHNLRGNGNFVGESPALRNVFRMLDEAAHSLATVLITGESGTGKELAARAIHERSDRAANPFVTVNCAAIQETLLESELFGHVKGAFTGATADRIGRFAQADTGTLFLDEIGDMPLHLQAKILRALQDKLVEPVGGHTARAVNVRIVAATNQDLEEAVQQGRFRRDLFFRLNVYPIHMPPLRERPEDVPLLAAHFSRLFADQSGKPAVRLEAAALERLQRHNWPGNVRELQNLMERLAISRPGEMVSAEVLDQWLPGQPGPLPVAPPVVGDLVQCLEDMERRMILAALEQAGGVQAKAAALLNINERSIWHRIKKLGIAAGRKGQQS